MEEESELCRVTVPIIQLGKEEEFKASLGNSEIHPPPHLLHKNPNPEQLPIGIWGADVAQK